MLVSKVEITLKNATWCAALTCSDLLRTYLSITVKMCKDVDGGEGGITLRQTTLMAVNKCEEGARDR